MLCSLASAAGQPPKLRLSEVQDVAPVRYQVDLTLDPEKDSFSGSVAIQVNLNKPAQTIWLNASQIAVEVASVAAGGKTWPAKPLPGGDDFVGLQFESAVPSGTAEIRIRYRGSLRKGGSSGVFGADDAGNHYIFTQFEATDARDAFPCFDEPSYKTPWQLTLHVPPQDTAVSNTPVVSERNESGLKTMVFKETKPLPSYLVAFAVGPFDFVDAGHAGKNQVPVRIVTPKGKADEAKYAAEVTATILTRLEEYFGIPYPYEKSDQVAVPVTVGFGAMENAGMVTYGQTALLAKPATDTIRRQRGYATTAAHELSHQWFGDLVTTAWWDDIWLNEAFATWMEQKLVAAWKPEWKTRVNDVDAKSGAEGQDSLVTARKIRQAIETKDDISNAFDGITYDKGAAVIGMFENWMGADDFRKGVQSYLSRYAFKNATAGDFLDSLSSASRKDVTAAFSTFLNQAGVPLVSVALDCTQKPPSLHLEQTRFFPLGSKGSGGQSWSIPVCVRYDGHSQFECALVTRPKWDMPLQSATSCPAWVEANADAKGYYLPDYRGGLLGALTGASARLEPAERVDLIANVEEMASAGKLPAAEALGLAEAFHNDPERLVLQRALGVALSYREYVAPEVAPNYQRFLLKNFQARARESGWIPRAGESDDARLLRTSLLSAVATYGGDSDLAQEARSLAGRWLDDRSAVPAEMAGPVLNAAAYYGDVALFNRYLAEFQKTQDRQDKQRLIGAMTSFHDPKAIDAALQAVLSKSIALVDGFALLVSAGQDFPDTRKMPFQFIKAHFDQIVAGNPSIFGNDLGSFLPFAGGSFCDAESKKELQAFFSPLVNKYTGAPRNLAQVLESIDLCIANKAAQAPSVNAFLQRY
ncbi:MAG TPA: M1 family metallopeptidase [Bryobacteraceae bacterium]|nr:M1 family metallopeptidase [Bryobacteraceae bacterium]